MWYTDSDPFIGWSREMFTFFTIPERYMISYDSIVSAIRDYIRVFQEPIVLPAYSVRTDGHAVVGQRAGRQTGRRWATDWQAGGQAGKRADGQASVRTGKQAGGRTDGQTGKRAGRQAGWLAD